MHLIWCTIFFFSFLEGISSRNFAPDQETSLTTDSLRPTENYIVDNSLCRIPDYSPYHDSIKKYLWTVEPIICSNSPPLTYVTFNAKTKTHTLQVNESVVEEYWATMSSLKCCFSIITRKYHNGSQNETNDNRYDKYPEQCWKSNVELPATAENIYVNCTSGNQSIFQTIYFLPIDKQPEVAISNATTNKKYSIFMFVIDTVSRQNFMRTLPKTRKYIEERGWLPLEGYVKVGENTLPNAIPIFTGMNESQLRYLCFPDDGHRLDDCPFIWKTFSKNGYLTSYSEDTAWMATFNYQKYGFMNSPTHYYSRPILKFADEASLKWKNDFCLGPIPEVEHLFRFNTEFLQRFHDRPYFNLFWTNSFSHDFLNMPMIMDDRIETLLKDIEPYLNSTVVVFFGDHGFRMGDIRNTTAGWQEDKTPFIYFHLPPSLKKSHPHWVRNLQANKNKLTSPFDLHATLQQLLSEEVSDVPAGCPRCGSLFAPVSNERSCADAAIDEPYCPCWTRDGTSADFKPPKFAPK